MFVKIMAIHPGEHGDYLRNHGLRVGNVYAYGQDGTREEGSATLQSQGGKWRKVFAWAFLHHNVTMEEVPGWPQEKSVLPREYLRDVYREHLLKYGESDAKHAVECIVQAQKDGVF